MADKAPDFDPPQASVSRIIKQVLPNNVQLTKDARAAFTRAAGIFIFYLTHTANEFSKENKRSTILPADIKNALRELDFDEFEAPMEEFMELYKKMSGEKKAKAKVASSSSSSSSGSADGGGGMEMDESSRAAGEDDEDA